MPNRNFLLLLLLLVTTGPVAITAQPSQPPPPVFSPCRLEHPSGLASVEAECSHLAVPESRSAPQGRQLQLFVARIPSLSRRRAPEPLFILAGGPGLGASAFYSGTSSAFARIRRNHDIVIVDQRGTGKSHPLNCPIDEQTLWDAGDTEIARIMRDCRNSLAREHDLTQYTTSVAVQDLDTVRQRLGYARIALYGSSYGTRVAQHYARRFPEHTHALILDGVVPPTRILGTTTPLDAEAALTQIFSRCVADAACRQSFGDPAEDYRQLREKLAAAAVPVTLADPRSGLPTQLSFSAPVLAAALRLASYSSEQAALLPLALHLANDRGEFGPLAAQYLLTAASYDAVLAYGMHNSVVCTEDVPLFATQSIDRAKLAQTFLGTAQLDSLEALCREWPRGVLDADLHQPLASDVPALLLSGTADPVTPAAFGSEAARGLRRSLHLQLTHQGHGQLMHSCIDRLMAGFIDAPDAANATRIDTRCAESIRPAPFFLTVNGPGP